MRKSDELRGRRWADNLSTTERVNAQMASRGNQTKVLRGSRYTQAGNQSERQLRVSVPQEKVLYDYDSISDTILNATPVVWRNRADEGIHRTDTSIGVGGFLPIAQNQWSGFEWNSTLILPQDGLRPPDESITFLIELLDASGAVLKMATKFFRQTGGGVTYTNNDWTVDSNGPIAEFWQIRITLTGTFNVSGVLVGLNWILGSVGSIFDSPIIGDEPVRRLSVHSFTTHLLTPNTDSDISWWNAADHNEPIPWRPDRSYARVVNSFLKSATGGILNLSGLALHLWCVDSAGADLFELIYFLSDLGAVIPDAYGAGLATKAHGLKWKFGALGGATATIDVQSSCILEWDFTSADQSERVVLPLAAV